MTGNRKASAKPAQGGEVHYEDAPQSSGAQVNIVRSSASSPPDSEARDLGGVSCHGGAEELRRAAQSAGSGEQLQQ